jgi:hypothetical protein
MFSFCAALHRAEREHRARVCPMPAAPPHGPTPPTFGRSSPIQVSTLHHGLPEFVPAPNTRAQHDRPIVARTDDIPRTQDRAVRQPPVQFGLGRGARRDVIMHHRGRLGHAQIDEMRDVRRAGSIDSGECRRQIDRAELVSSFTRAIRAAAGGGFAVGDGVDSHRSAVAPAAG